MGTVLIVNSLLMIHTLKSLLLSVSGIRTLSELLSDRVAKNLMYIEAVAEVTGRWGGGEGRAYLTAEGQKKEVSEAGMRK